MKMRNILLIIRANEKIESYILQLRGIQLNYQFEQRRQGLNRQHGFNSEHPDDDDGSALTIMTSGDGLSDHGKFQDLRVF
jgi:hypothetical protein